MPGYTHLQRAQPVYLSHHLLAYVWMLLRDERRFAAVLEGTSALPLGAGALAGVNFDTDRTLVAAELGFGGVAENSIDAVSNRDFVLDYLAAAATCATHLSRLGAEIVLWSSERVRLLRGVRRVGFGLLDHAAEEEPRRRGAAAREGAAGRRSPVALHGVMHGLPLTYNKDMQEDKEHLFDAVDTLELSLAAATGMIAIDPLQPRARSPPRPPTSSSRRPTSPTCSSSAGCRSARRTGSSRDSCAAPSRRASRSRS